VENIYFFKDKYSRVKCFKSIKHKFSRLFDIISNNYWKLQIFP